MLREVVGKGSVLRVEQHPQLRNFGAGALDDLDQLAGLGAVRLLHFVKFTTVVLIHGAHLAIACGVVRRQNILHFAIPCRVLCLQCLAELAA